VRIVTRARVQLEIQTTGSVRKIAFRFNHDSSAEAKSSGRFAAIICSPSALSSAAFVMTTMLMRRELHHK
jgi:hypothetical protein